MTLLLPGDLHRLDDLDEFLLHLVRIESRGLGLLEDAGDGGLVQPGQECLQAGELLGEKLRIPAEEFADAGDGLPDLLLVHTW
jgi:hypothetical protein